MANTNEILSNVAWLVAALDDDALREVRDLPFLELAKAVSIAHPLARSGPLARGRHTRMQVRYPIRMTAVARH